MSKNESFGWELLYAACKSQINTKQDVIVCFVHWVLVSNGYHCVGVGDDISQFSDDDKSELLPPGWNETPRVKLRYVSNGTIFVLTVVPDDNNVLVNLNRPSENRVTGLLVSLEEVTSLAGPANNVFRDITALTARARDKLIVPYTENPIAQSTSTQTAPAVTRDPHRSSVPSFSPFAPMAPMTPINPLLNVGHSDLYPFGGIGGGGMLMEPPGLGPMPNLGPAPLNDPLTGLPHGSIPPGARFDPFRPPGAVPRRPPLPRNPDADQLPPPGYDDMFM